jgi:hypothetical protein
MRGQRTGQRAIITELLRLRAEGFVLLPDIEAPAAAVVVGRLVWFDPSRLRVELVAALRKIDTSTPQI